MSRNQLNVADVTYELFPENMCNKIEMKTFYRRKIKIKLFRQLRVYKAYKKQRKKKRIP